MKIQYAEQVRRGQGPPTKCLYAYRHGQQVVGRELYDALMVDIKAAYKDPRENCEMKKVTREWYHAHKGKKLSDVVKNFNPEWPMIQFVIEP